jgi:hypothetical protein
LTLVALLAVIGYVALSQAPAEAEHLRWLSPGYFPPPPSRRVYRYYPEIYEDDFYDDDYDDEVYYGEEPEPFYEPKPRKKKKKSTAKAPAKVKPQTAEKPKNEKAKKKPAQTASAPKPKKTMAAKTTAKTTVSDNVSCDKAKSIVTGYGFSDIQTMSCSGSIYSFAANRGGKSFAVKVSALNGELTEVKRQ